MDSLFASLADRIRQAAASGTPLRIRGGGSKDLYGEPCEGELLLTGVLDGIVSYEPSELYVTVRAGTPLATLEAALAAQGQCLPFEPPHFGAATVGGMVAAGLSGPARASAGSVRDHVLGVSLINGRGEFLTFGGQVMKNVAGYDVSRLMAGALGTLGLLVEISLKVLPVAPAEATLRFSGMTQEQALAQLHRWGSQPLPLNASRWQAEGGDTVLHVRLRGAQAAVQAACRELGGERVDDAQARRDWAACREIQLPWFAARAPDVDLWRLSVPQTAPVLDVPEASLVEWHGAQRWVRAARAQASRVREAAVAAGGHATLFLAGEGAGPVPARFTPLDPVQARLQRGLQRAFDPAGIFNRGRLLPES
jgi:glycolate oxidase FAD binding subunit